MLSAGGQVMRDPVVAGDGFTYERAALERWLAARGAVSPVTGAPLPHPHIVPNQARGSTSFCAIPHHPAAATATHPYFGDFSKNRSIFQPPGKNLPLLQQPLQASMPPAPDGGGGQWGSKGGR